MSALTHGHSVRQIRQGAATPTYRSWQEMLRRCRNPRVREYPNYGGRGITVCDRWLSFEHFLADMGTRPTPNYSLDRIDNSGNYGPDNCRWATRKEQQRNTRRNHFVEYNGQRCCVSEWAQILDMDRRTLLARLRIWGICPRTFEEPVHPKRSKKRCLS